MAGNGSDSFDSCSFDCHQQVPCGAPEQHSCEAWFCRHDPRVVAASSFYLPAQEVLRRITFFFMHIHMQMITSTHCFQEECSSVLIRDLSIPLIATLDLLNAGIDVRTCVSAGEAP